jgi:rhamnose utilization protein RhaD (predicted bifunctional aldolase and dehydrogenase)/NAD(P)-dependent dehydrogenase (short-subunit alcohol dehydrogenase family)
MKNAWNSLEAANFSGDLRQRVYSSRLLGNAPSLVLQGGGNTSVKILEKNILGDDEAILYIKGSGGDLANIEVAGFSPCRMEHLIRLSSLSSLSDVRMAAELRCCMTNPSAPNPSVEAILHAVLPAKFVDHTHADAFISISNTLEGEEHIHEIYGDRVAIMPYVMPGFKLARACAVQLPRKMSANTIGVALMKHGLITFGATAEESYRRMIELVSLAEEYLARHKAWIIEWPKVDAPSKPSRADLAAFRRDLSAVMGAPAIVTSNRDSQCLGFIWRPDAGAISQQGPATPDHVLRTKRLPMLGRNLKAYRAAYETYYNKHAAGIFPKPPMLDPAPRVILDPEWGMLVAGRTTQEASVVGEIYRHTMDIIAQSTALGGWEALPAQAIFEVEYWDLEQAKLRRPARASDFVGEIALVTGAASGIGRACVDAFLQRGAAVVGLDVNPSIVRMHDRPDFRGITCDLTRETDVASALEEAVRAFGGVDMLVLNAGIFPPGKVIGELGTETWRKTMALNLDASFVMMRECHPLLKVAPKGGRVVVIGSKNVSAPGLGAAAYSASKAAMNQLARVAALEWGADKIRINSIHPNMVFDTALWTKELLESRARNQGLSVEAYKTNNILSVEITSRDVALLAAELCGPLFAKTTGAQIPVDGGNERVV